MKGKKRKELRAPLQEDYDNARDAKKFVKGVEAQILEDVTKIKAVYQGLGLKFPLPREN